MPATSAPEVEIRSAIAGSKHAAKRAPFLDKHFYFMMSLLLPVIVAYGFSHTVNDNLLHAVPPRPLILWFHGAVFVGWLFFFIFQSALIQTHNVKVHRLTGWFGAALGASMAVLGVSTAIIMTRFHIRQLHAGPEAPAFLIAPLWDMASFGTFFALAVLWRKKPEFHRRSIFIATCAVTSAAFGRFPPSILPQPYFYVGVDLLILLGVARDLIVNRRVHPVYRYALPLLMLGQIFVVYTFTHNLPYWQKISHAILG
ncbi:MAG TPA: hypothetical protein VLY23_06515 [Candidatus Acidoferrum sp.]|nr:hypothetical protein [Candidatus Acidoferrum sp.]